MVTPKKKSIKCSYIAHQLQNQSYDTEQLCQFLPIWNVHQLNPIQVQNGGVFN